MELNTCRMSNKRKHMGIESDVSVDERPPKSSNNEETKQSETSDCSKQTETPRKTTFAQTFGYLKNTDMYKLPEKPPEVPQAAPRNSNAIIVNSCQRGNPILKFVKNVPYEYGDIIPDYQIGERHCALFLSLRYHNLNPNYIHERLALLGNKYDLRIVLVQVDIKNCKHSLKELSKICMLASCTLVLSWSAEEAGRYLETYKQYENKPPDILQERVETDYFAQVQDVLTTVKSINKTDAITLLSAFGSLKNIINASKDEIVLCPGFGQQKAQRLHKVFNEPFRRSVTNESCSEQLSTPSVKDGQLPSTSKLKRPSEINISLRKSESTSPDGKVKRPNLEKGAKSASSPAKISKLDISVEQPVKISKDKADISLEEKCNKSTVTHEKIDSTPPIIQPSPKKSDSLDCSSPKKVHRQTSPHQAPQTSNKSTHSNKMSKTQAVLNSGLSRYRKEERDSNTVKASPQKTPDKNYNEKYSKTSPEKKTMEKHHIEKQSKTENSFTQNTHNKQKEKDKSRKRTNSESRQDSANTVSTRVAHQSEKLTSPLHNTITSPSKNLLQTDASRKTMPKDSHSASGSSNITCRTLAVGNEKLSKNEGKFRGGACKPTSECENISEVDNYSNTQITNEEFNDLLASDDDDDDDIYAGIL